MQLVVTAKTLISVVIQVLEIPVDVSSSCICQDGRLAEDLKTPYDDMPGTER